MHQFSSLTSTDMSLNGYTIEIVTLSGVTNSRTINGAHYVPLDDRTEYKLRIHSNKGVRTDATVWIDGNKVGVWRVKPYGSITIERPVNNARKFTFLKEGSQAARQGGIVTGKEENGLIKVVFKHEIQEMLYNMEYDTDSFGTSMSYSNDGMNSIPERSSLLQNYSSGGTALGDHSSQTFKECSPLYNVDHSDVTTIIARLVCDEGDKYVPLGLYSSTKYPRRL